jgi:hypothetical protein
MAMRDSSTKILNKLADLARERGLTPISSGLAHQINANTWYLRFMLKLRPEDYLFADVSHWVRLVDPNASYVAAYFKFDCIDSAPAIFPEPYYKEPAADTRRLFHHVEEKARDIFATLLANLMA